MSRNPFSLKRPCAHCPHRTDVHPYLQPGRVDRIVHDLDTGKWFPCHEDNTLVCAGSVLVCEREGRKPRFLRIAVALEIYDPAQMDQSIPVFDSYADMRKAMEEADK